MTKQELLDTTTGNDRLTEEFAQSFFTEQDKITVGTMQDGTVPNNSWEYYREQLLLVEDPNEYLTSFL